MLAPAFPLTRTSLVQKDGCSAKKALTWIGSREWKQQQAEAEEARAARMERMRFGYDSKRMAKQAAGALVSDANELHSNEELLSTLAAALEPLKSDAFQREVLFDVGSLPVSSVVVTFFWGDCCEQVRFELRYTMARAPWTEPWRVGTHLGWSINQSRCTGRERSCWRLARRRVPSTWRTIWTVTVRCVPLHRAQESRLAV
jgi:hypothetical protein